MGHWVRLPIPCSGHGPVVHRGTGRRGPRWVNIFLSSGRMLWSLKVNVHWHVTEWQVGPQFFISLKGLDMQPITLRFRGRGWGKYHSLNQDLNLQPQFPSPVPLPHGHGTSLLDGREDFIFCWVVSVHRERACWQRLTRARSWWVYLCCVRVGWLIYLYCDMVSIFVLCMVWAG